MIFDVSIYDKSQGLFDRINLIVSIFTLNWTKANERIQPRKNSEDADRILRGTTITLHDCANIKKMKSREQNYKSKRKGSLWTQSMKTM